MEHAGELLAPGQQRKIVAREDAQGEHEHGIYDDRHGDRRAHAQKKHPPAAALGEQEARAERVHAEKAITSEASSGRRK